MNTMTLRILPALLAAAFSGAATAGAFQLWEQNASGIATSYAGSAAVADNASTVYFNPAGMTRLPGLQVSLGVSGIGTRFKFNDGGSDPVSGLSGNGGNAGNWAAVPNAHLSWQVAPDWFVGLGISSPFGLRTQYDDNWIGSYQSLKSEVTTVNYNPSIAWRVSDKVSLGLGINYQTIDAELTSLVPGAQLHKLQGDDSAWGWNAGALFTLSPTMRLGVSYRSAVKYTLAGTASLGLDSTGAKADLKLPELYIISVWQQVSERWEAMGDLSYMRWSSLDALNVRYSSPLAEQPGASEQFGYENAWRIAWGAAYKANEAWKIKFGIAYDRTPTTDANRTTRVPDNDRIGLSFGAQWNGGAYGRVDVGYAYLYLRDPSLNQTKDFGSSVTSTLRGSYSDSAHIVGIQYSQGF